MRLYKNTFSMFDLDFESETLKGLVKACNLNKTFKSLKLLYTKDVSFKIEDIKNFCEMVKGINNID